MLGVFKEQQRRLAWQELGAVEISQQKKYGRSDLENQPGPEIGEPAKT